MTLGNSSREFKSFAKIEIGNSRKKAARENFPVYSRPVTCISINRPVEKACLFSYPDSITHLYRRPQPPPETQLVHFNAVLKSKMAQIRTRYHLRWVFKPWVSEQVADSPSCVVQCSMFRFLCPCPRSAFSVLVGSTHANKSLQHHIWCKNCTQWATTVVTSYWSHTSFLSVTTMIEIFVYTKTIWCLSVSTPC